MRRQAAKDMILAEQAREQDARHGAVRDDFSNLVLAEFSDKTFWYDPAGQWEYSMMEVSGIDTAPFREATTTAVMDRPLNGYRWPCKDPDNVMPEAYEGEGNCVVRQLCAMYGLEQEDVEEEFNAIGDWSEGITARQILEWCRRRGVSGYCVWNNCLVAKHEAERERHDKRSA